MIGKFRAACQALFFIFSVLVVSGFFASRSPAEFFNSLHIFPFLSSMASGTPAAFWPLALLVAVLPLAAGRLYCSFLCPLGALQDAFFALSRSLRMKARPSPVYPYLRTFLVFLCFFAAAFPAAALWGWFDHLSNFGRLAAAAGSLAGRPRFDFAFAYALFFAALTAVSSLLRPRWFCAVVCPSGAFFAALFKKSFMRLGRDATCTGCGKCEKKCPAQCIDRGDIDAARCVTCFECVGDCPSGSIKVSFSPPPAAAPQKDPASPDTGRRAAIKGVLSAAAGVFVAAVFKKLAPGSAFRIKTVMPPGALSAQSFLSRCSACHICVSACPTKVIVPSGLENGLAGLSKPRLDFRRSYCANDCAECSAVCPSGALQYQRLEEKRNLTIGLVALNSGPDTRCVAYRREKACSACADSCPTGAVFMRNENGFNVPKIWRRFCIGCGRCEFACPVAGEGKPIVVVPLPRQVRIRPMNEEEKAKIGKK